MNSNSGIAPDFNLIGKVALITGAGRGIGRACALACAASGADIVLGVRDINSASDLIAEIETLGRQVLPVKLDISRGPDVDASVAAAIARFGRIDILVNNVGVAPGNPAEDVTEKDFDLIFRSQPQRHILCDASRHSHNDQAQVWTHH
jgi:NAD(P)-dependent dehydrogenase (short-subunit alcohol dehydrogenase family)